MLYQLSYVGGIPHSSAGLARDLLSLPPDLPRPEDDDGAAHLVGTPVPALALPATDGRLVDPRAVDAERAVVYCYPRTGRPGEPSLAPGWDEIPGARGCTPQSCSFRDHHDELRELGAAVFGLSTQDTEYQREAAERLHLPFPLLSDADLALTRALRLPTFTVAGHVLLKRLTFVVRDRVVEHVWYPVFPPDRNAVEVVEWLRAQASGGRRSG